MYYVDLKKLKDEIDKKYQDQAKRLNTDNYNSVFTQTATLEELTEFYNEISELLSQKIVEAEQSLPTPEDMETGKDLYPTPKGLVPLEELDDD